ncbi:hypothetical protein ACP70R_021117 [Stipagrostis hirtigluma subsp. patula]
MAAAAGGWLRRAAAAVPRVQCGLLALTNPQPAPVLEAPAIALPALGAAMELMAVPKKKVIGKYQAILDFTEVSKYKKGLRNGPKALKPVPVIVRCNVLWSSEAATLLLLQRGEREP